jgi:hypothetical protein
MKAMRKVFDRLLSIRLWQIGLVLALLSALLPLRYSAEYLIQSATNKQKEIGDGALNKLFYDYYATYGFRGKILTDYQLFYGLPDINRYYMFEFTNQTYYIKRLKVPEVAYSLYCVHMADPEVVHYLEERVATGEYKQIFEYACWHFVSLCKDTCQ